MDGRLHVVGVVSVALLHLQLPALRVFAVAIVGPVVLLVLLHGEDVAEEPLENVCVAVNADVDFVVVRDLLQTLVEVLHVLDQQAPRKVEVALVILRVVDHVDHDVVLEVRALNRVNQVLVGFLASCLVLGVRVVGTRIIVAPTQSLVLTLIALLVC